ncbi:MAG: hypothetical protein GOV02_04370 [Candidatus Aenigmarchaeota archaeon]|nr:hypothetical protein [Candidatus Aenigmarchaeota archaeon]
MQDQDQESVFEDFTVVAACSLPEFQKKYNLTITPFKQSSGKVGFRILGNVDGAIAEIYTNKKVGLLSFMKEIRSVRNAIFTIRNSGNSKVTQR